MPDPMSEVAVALSEARYFSDDRRVQARFNCQEYRIMCRNIKTLANFAPPATDDEVHASALQFVRKLSGTNKPSKVNEEAFNRAVDEVTRAARTLIDSLEIHAPPKDREEERRKAKERSLKRFA